MAKDGHFLDSRKWMGLGLFGAEACCKFCLTNQHLHICQKTGRKSVGFSFLRVSFGHKKRKEQLRQVAPFPLRLSF
jgi:hypothetical protein